MKAGWATNHQNGGSYL